MSSNEYPCGIRSGWMSYDLYIETYVNRVHLSGSEILEE